MPDLFAANATASKDDKQSAAGVTGATGAVVTLGLGFALAVLVLVFA